MISLYKKDSLGHGTYMMFLKLQRMTANPTLKDDQDDIIGYSHCVREILFGSQHLDDISIEDCEKQFRYN